MVLYKCKNCGTLYDFNKSKSSLKLTYCNNMCEVKDLGFHLLSLENGTYTYTEKEIEQIPEEILDNINTNPTPPPPENNDDPPDDLMDVVF